MASSRQGKLYYVNLHPCYGYVEDITEKKEKVAEQTSSLTLLIKQPIHIQCHTDIKWQLGVIPNKENNDITVDKSGTHILFNQGGSYYFAFSGGIIPYTDTEDIKLYVHNLPHHPEIEDLFTIKANNRDLQGCYLFNTTFITTLEPGQKISIRGGNTDDISMILHPSRLIVFRV